MVFTGMNHMAFITKDMAGTIRFYRDLLEMDLFAGIGHDGFRHYFFKCGEGAIAFFEYDIAQPMEYDKFHGAPTDKPIGFDHVSLTVPSREALFALKDKLEAAGWDVHGAVDHGIMWSIYFFDPNNIPLEATWDCMELVAEPAIEDDDPMPVADEGAAPQSGHWPAVTNPTPAEAMIAHGGNGVAMRDSFLARGLARATPDLAKVLAENDENTEAAE
jgi:catechol 2,3-dioxygenase-like lactoylglutathione lyase family enzyme